MVFIQTDNLKKKKKEKSCQQVEIEPNKKILKYAVSDSGEPNKFL